MEPDESRQPIDYACDRVQPRRPVWRWIFVSLALGPTAFMVFLGNGYEGSPSSPWLDVLALALAGASLGAWIWAIVNSGHNDRVSKAALPQAKLESDDEASKS